MDHDQCSQALQGLPLGGLRFFERIDSTNNEAAFWAEQGAPDLALVIAEEQTAGRGRHGRRWFTPPGSALAFSLVIKPTTLLFEAGDHGRYKPPLQPDQVLSRVTGLGALAVSEALRQDYALQAQIKWPNDVLLAKRKVAGVLAEAHWLGDQLAAVILGIGVNVSPASEPPENEVVFPASCIEAALGCTVDRPLLLRSILVHLLAWRQQIGHPLYIQTWEQQLAFRGEWVSVQTNVQILHRDNNPAPDAKTVQIIGLDAHGRLLVKDRQGASLVLHMGEVRLSPAIC